ncbi:MAG: CAP domain-containing protein [Gammaproteobacteria bacterium]|nr:CAP domain-containing protein [Gammaproteobacteria bacterium]
MKTLKWLAILQALILAGILWLNPVFSHIGAIAPPNTGGGEQEPPVASKKVPKSMPQAKTAADMMLKYIKTADTGTQQPPAGISFLEKAEDRILALVNKERRRRKLKALKPDNFLRKAARAHSLDMLQRNFFDHATPEGKTSQDRIAMIHRTLIGTTGENIWMRDGSNMPQPEALAKQAMQGWMNSPGHRENILRSNFTHLGVGAAAKNGSIRLTQNFSSTQALLRQELPDELSIGDLLDLKADLVSQKSAPVRYDFWMPDKGVSLAASKIKDTRIDNLSPGEYRMRFYFPVKKQFFIYSGPQVAVK